MKLKIMIVNAIRSLKQNSRRSILTMIGIIVGVSSVITILALGDGFKEYTLKNLNVSEGNKISTNIMFTPEFINIDEISSYFSEEDLTIIKSVEGVSKVRFNALNSDSFNEEILLKSSKISINVLLTESTTDKIIVGRDLSRYDNYFLNKVVVISDQLARYISEDFQDVIGFGINIKGEFYSVIGIFKSDSDFKRNIKNTEVKLPKGTYSHYNPKPQIVSNINIEIMNGYSPTKVTNNVISKLSEFGSMKNEGIYESIDVTELTNGISNILSILTVFISGVASISLFIAGVGVMNMMYSSISERTREIGIRRALGAKQFHIFEQFLIEGLVLATISGAIGYSIGFFLAKLISTFLPFSIYPSWHSIVVATGITTFIGIIFSVGPAISASKKVLIDIIK